MSDSTETLALIQRLQFKDRHEAEELLMVFFRSLGLAELECVKLNVKPESLNSINGIVSFKDKTQLFFKSHVEENEKIKEYYNSEILAEAGYPVIKPVELRRDVGKQIAFYELVDFPTLFDLAAEEDARETERFDKLVEAQSALDRKILKVYQKTFLPKRESVKERAPIHQLFWNRLDENGRLGIFYRGKKLKLSTEEFSMESVFDWRWKINGVRYKETIGELIAGAKRNLDPDIALATVIGHGDAHNGNVFWKETENELLYFDPAFAGRHSPIFDVAKPLFHNVFARWMYFPQEVAEGLSFSYKLKANEIEIEHDYFPAPIRREFLKSKVENLLKPMLSGLLPHSEIDDSWVDVLKSALLCCSLLTVNLAADFDSNGKLAERYPSNIKLLGLAMAVEVAATAVTGINGIRQLCLRYENLRL